MTKLWSLNREAGHYYKTQEEDYKEGKGYSTLFSTQEKPVLEKQFKICLTWVNNGIFIY